MSYNFTMSQEQMTPITAAVIALLSSLLSFLLASIFQILRDDRKRKWELEDRKLQRRHSVLNSRLQDVVTSAEKHLVIASKLLNYEMDFVTHKNLKEYQEKIEELIPEVIGFTKELSSISNIKDEELNNNILELLDIVAKELNISIKLRDDFAKGEFIDRDVEVKRISNFFLTVNHKKTAVMKRIDELSGFDN